MEKQKGSKNLNLTHSYADKVIEMAKDQQDTFFSGEAIKIIDGLEDKLANTLYKFSLSNARKHNEDLVTKKHVYAALQLLIKELEEYYRQHSNSIEA